MRLFTKLVFSTLLALSSLVSAFASTITVTVGDNFYRDASGSNIIRATTADDIVFSYPTGSSSHPTASDNGAFATFPMNSNARTKTFTAGQLPAGTYPFHCTAHGAPGIGQFGRLEITLPTATKNAFTATVVNLFPNPSKGQVTLQLSQRPGQDVKLRLNNVIGQEVRLVALKPELLAEGQVISLAELPSGVYFYSLLVNDKVMSTKRLVLQNN